MWRVGGDRLLTVGMVFSVQMLLLQESDEDDSGQDPQSTTGRVPRNITCFVDRDLVDSCVPGDFVHVCGVVSLLSAFADTGNGGLFSSANRRPFGSVHEASAGKNNIFNLCLRANNLTRIFSRVGEDGRDSGKVTQCLTTRRQESHTNGKVTAANLSKVADIQITTGASIF